MAHPVEFTSPHRRRHFEFFRRMNHPHFSITANVDVTRWLRAMKRRGLRLTPTLVHLLATEANRIPAFRQRIRGEGAIEHEVVHPSFVVRTDETDVFSFCTVSFEAELATFVARASAEMEARRVSPSLEDDPERDDFLFMSAIPWVSFTAVQHAMSYHPHDSVPRFAWGKIFTQGRKRLMPLSVQAHHALVDGIHAGRFFEAVEHAVATVDDGA